MNSNSSRFVVRSSSEDIIRTYEPTYLDHWLAGRDHAAVAITAVAAEQSVGGQRVGVAREVGKAGEATEALEVLRDT